MSVFRLVLAQYGITKYRVPFETKFDKSDWIITKGRVNFYRQIQDELKMSDHDQFPFIGYSIMGTVFISPSSPNPSVVKSRVRRSDGSRLFTAPFGVRMAIYIVRCKLDDDHWKEAPLFIMPGSWNIL